MPLPYGQVKDLYDELHKAGVVTQSLPEWSGSMNDLTGTDQYSEGLHDNWIRSASHGLDKVLDASGLNDVTGAVGRAIGTPFGLADAGESAGRGFTRGLIDFAPVLAAGLLAPETGGGSLALLGALGTGALSGAHTYADTGSVGAGVASGITNAIIPGVAERASQFALGKLGARFLSQPTTDALGNIATLKKYLPQSVGLGSRLLAEGAGQAAAFGTMGVGQVAEQALDPNQQVSNPFTGANLLSLGIQTLPFAALHAAGSLIRPGAAYDSAALDRNIASTQEALQKQAELREAQQSPPIVRNPQYDEDALSDEDKEKVGEASARISQLTSDLATPKDSAKVADPDDTLAKQNELADLQKEQFDKTGGVGTVDGQLVDPPPQITHVPLVGKDYTKSQNGKSATFTLVDHPTNAEQTMYDPGDRINYSTVYEHKGTPVDNGDGTVTVQVPVGYHQPVEDNRAVAQQLQRQAQPELPTQDSPGEPAKIFQQQALLKQSRDLLSQAFLEGDPQKLHNAKMAFRAAQEAAGFAPWDDAAMADFHATLNAGRTAITPEAALEGQTQTLEQRIQQKADIELKRKADMATMRQRIEGLQPGQTEIDKKPISDLEAGIAQRIQSAKNPDLIWKAVQSWDANGRKVPLNDLFDAIDDQQAKTKSKPKNELTSGQQLLKTALSDTPEAQHARDTVAAHAALAIDHASPDYDDEELADAQEWLDNLSNGKPMSRRLMSQPHIKDLNDELVDSLNQIGPRAPRPVQAPVPAGDKWVWGLGDFDATTDSLNGKPLKSLGAGNGIMPETRFRNLAGRGKPLNETELALGKVLVPEAFDGKGNVDVRKLYAGLKDREPVVETKTLGEVQGRKEMQSLNQIIHELDTRFGNWRDRPMAEKSQEEKDLIQRKIAATDATHEPESGTQYSFLGPKSEQNMPGYVEGLVRVPREGLIRNVRPDWKTLSEEGKAQERAAARGFLYNGPHFGSEDKNVLAFYRGYEETLPSGEKAFHVIEVQSDWAQRVKKEMDKAKTASDHVDPLDPYARTPAQFRANAEQMGHPLLAAYETLALKAAIQHAREVGATKIILSDAETAMMTEGHDKAAKETITNEPEIRKQVEAAGYPDPEFTIGNSGQVMFKAADPNSPVGQVVFHYLDPDGTIRRGRAVLGKIETAPTVENQVPQAGGMRLHYDTSLPSALRKLTGDRGEKVELGLHKAGLGEPPYEDFHGTQEEADAARRPNQQTIQNQFGSFQNQDVNGSPVFRDATGAPKTQITGTVYDLGEAFRRQDEQTGASTLGDPTRSPQQVPAYKTQNADELATINRLGLNKTGTDIVQNLAKDATFGGLARDLLKRFPNALSRIIPQVVADDSGSRALRARDNVTNLLFSRAVLGMNGTNQKFEVMHEMVHGLTEHALHDPNNTETVKQLDDLRQRLVQALPADSRARYEQLQSNGWYNRYAYGDPTVSLTDLGNTPKEQMRMYGLLTNSELLAQGFSSSDMRQYMQSVKGDRTTGWQKFKGFVKDILGIGEQFKGTAFDEFMDHAARLMTSGEEVAQAHNFLESYFRQQGIGQLEAQRQTTRALGILGGTRWDLSPDGIINTLGEVQPVSSTEIIQSLRGLNQMFQERGEEYAVTSSVMDELGHTSNKSGVDEMIDAAVRGDTDLSDALKLLPDATTRYVYAKLNDYRTVLDAVRGAVSKVNENLLNVQSPQEVRGPVTNVLNSLDSVLENQSQHDADVAAIQALFAVDPQGFMSQRGVMAPPTGGLKTPADFVEPTSKKLWDGFVNWTQQMGQLAKTNPETAELINHGFWMKPQTRWMANQMMRPFALDLKDPESGFAKSGRELTSAVFRDKKVLAAVDNWIFQSQKKGGDSVVMLNASHPDVAGPLRGLTEQQRTLAENAVRMHGAMKTIAGNFILNHMADIASWDAAAILRENGNKASENFALTSNMFRTLAMTDWSDPQSGAAAQAQLSAVQSHMTPDQFLNLTKFMQAEVGKWNAHKEFFADNPDWATAKRYGKFLVEYMEGGKRVLAGVDSKKEADVLTRGKQVLDFRSSQRPGGDDDYVPSIAMDAAMRDKVAQAQATSDSILRNILSPDDFDQYQKYNAATQLLTEASGGGIDTDQVGYARTRQLTKGAEKLPWLENQFKWVQNTASYWNRAVFRAQARGMLNDPQIAANPQIQSRLAMHVDNMLRPDPETAQQMSKFVSTWMLGFRPSTAIVTASHSIIRHTAELTRLSGSPIDSFRRVGNALSEIVRTVTGGEQSPEHQWLLREADKFGERENGWFDDENSNQEKVVLDFLNDVKGQKPQSLGQQVASAGGTYSRVGMWMFQQARRINEESALYASYDYYRDQGLSQLEARDKAFEFNHAVNTVGGTAQRPAGLFQKGVPRTASMAAYSLKSYVAGTIGQLGRYIMEGSPFGREDMTPAEKWKARTAAMQMLGMQTAAAGLLGLPGITGAMSVLNQLYPQLQINQKAREGVSDLFGGDHWTTDAALGGLPSMLGWDLHSRLSLGNLIPGVNDNDGFQPSNLLGAPVNLATRWITGVKSGNVTDLLPTGVKDLMNDAQIGQPTTDFKGRPLFQPTMGENVGTALGFRSTRKSDADTQARMAEQTERVLNEKEGQWRQARATDVMKGNFGSVRQALLQRMQSDSNYDVNTAAQDIARGAEAMTFPYDPSREGNVQNSSARQALLSTFSLPQNNVSEVQRLQFRQGVLARLGVQTRPSESDLREAQLTDQLKAQSPNLTRAQARLQVSRMMSSRRVAPSLVETQ